MTPHKRRVRTLLSHVKNYLKGFIMLAALLVVGYQALFGLLPVLPSMMLVALAIALFVFRGDEMSRWINRNSKPLTQRYRGQRRARRASK